MQPFSKLQEVLLVIRWDDCRRVLSGVPMLGMLLIKECSEGISEVKNRFCCAIEVGFATREIEKERKKKKKMEKMTE